jgi:hypothetical protein
LSSSQATEGRAFFGLLRVQSAALELPRLMDTGFMLPSL